MKHLTVTIDNETLQKIERGHRRQFRQESGLNDGRFTTKIVKNKKSYSRKQKHKEW